MNVGIGGIDIGATARDLGQVVAQCVLGAQSREARVAQLLGHAAGGNGDGGAGADDGLPGDVVNAIVQLVGILRLKALEHHEHAARQARPQTGAIAFFELALKRSAALQAADKIPWVTSLVASLHYMMDAPFAIAPERNLYD